MTISFDAHAPVETPADAETYLRLSLFADTPGDIGCTIAGIVRIVDNASEAVTEGRDGPAPEIVRTVGEHWLTVARQVADELFVSGEPEEACEFRRLAAELDDALGCFESIVMMHEPGFWG